MVLEKGHHERTLLVNSLRGSALSEREVLSTWKKFIEDYDEELGNVTITDVRKAFSTIMYGKYRRRQICRDMNREEFLSIPF